LSGELSRKRFKLSLAPRNQQQIVFRGKFSREDDTKAARCTRDYCQGSCQDSRSSQH
jgi:hypothetical protein